MNKCYARHRAPAVAALTLMAVGVGACGTPVELSDRGTCRHDSEFGTTGCADITGIVTDQDGRAQAGISVGPRFPTDEHMFSTPYVTTGSDGRFSFRVRRYSPGPGASGPDTASVFVRAADPSTAGIGIPATVRDSVLGVVTIAPVGSIPVPLQLTIRLQR